MLAAALRDGSANRPTTFEVFARRLPTGRRYGVVAGTGRLLEALPQFRFDADACELLAQFLDPATVRYLREFRFRGDIDGYAEGELYFPGSPVLSVRGSFAECVLLETLVLSIFNHDTAIASAAARMVSAAGGRPLIEMGSRRTHERAAVAAARAAYIAGFAASSNLAAQRRYGVPAHGTAAHAFTMLHAQHGGPTELAERAAFRAQVEALGPGTTLLVDTYDVTTGVANAVAAAGAELGAIRIDSGELGVLARQAREQLDRLGATRTRIVVSGDLDEFSIAALRGEPVDSYGVGTSLVTGSGAPTANMVYKLVEVDGVPVQKRSSYKESPRRPQRGTAALPCDGHHHRGARASGGPSAGHCRAAPGFDAATGPRRATGSRYQPGRGTAAGGIRVAQPASRRAEIGTRRAGDSDTHDPGLSARM